MIRPSLRIAPFRLLAAAMAAVMLFTTCSYRRPVALPTDSPSTPPALTENDVGKRVVVALLSGGEVKGRLAAINVDALEIRESAGDEPLRIPLADIERIEVIQLKQGAKDALLITGFITLVVTIILVKFVHDLDEQWGD